MIPGVRVNLKLGRKRRHVIVEAAQIKRNDLKVGDECLIENERWFVTSLEPTEMMILAPNPQRANAGMAQATSKR